MDERQVVSYALAWHPRSRNGFARITLKGGENMTVPVEAPEDLAALAVVLRESPVFLRGDGLLFTGWEEVKD